MRPCVGIDSPKMLYEHRIANPMAHDEDGTPYTFLTTRNTPKRAKELMNGGSVYWITKAAIRMRQSIINVETLQDENNKKYCKIWMEPEIILVTPKPQRAMQGWRYLEPEKAPEDLYPFDPEHTPENEVDPQMAKELSDLGLL